MGLRGALRRQGRTDHLADQLLYQNVCVFVACSPLLLGLPSGPFLLEQSGRMILAQEKPSFLIDVVVIFDVATFRHFPPPKQAFSGHSDTFK